MLCCEKVIWYDKDSEILWLVILILEIIDILNGWIIVEIWFGFYW